MSDRPLRRSSIAIRNERTKITASGLNTISVALIVAGVIAPLTGAFYGTGVANTHLWWVATICYVCCAAAVHVAARALLGRLVE